MKGIERMHSDNSRAPPSYPRQRGKKKRHGGKRPDRRDAKIKGGKTVRDYELR